MKFDLEGYSEKVEPGKGVQVYIWKEDEPSNRLHRGMDKPAIVTVKNNNVVSAEWFEYGVRHRSLGKPAVVKPNVVEYWFEGKKYSPDELNFDFEQPLRNRLMNLVLQRYFFNYGIDGSLITEFAKGKIRVMNDTCYSVIMDPGTDSLYKNEAGSTCLRVTDYGVEVPEQTKLESDKLYRFIAYFVNSELIIDVMEPRFMDIRSSENHLVLMTIHPLHGNRYRYLVSGELKLINGKFVDYNFNSDIFRDFHVKGAREMFREQVMELMMDDMIHGKLDKLYSLVNSQREMDYVYMLVNSLYNNDNIWNSLMEAIIWEIMGYEPGSLTTDFGDVSSSHITRRELQEKWCGRNLSMELQNSKGQKVDICNHNPPPKEEPELETRFRNYEGMSIRQLVDEFRRKYPEVILKAEEMRNKHLLIQKLLNLEKGNKSAQIILIKT